MKNVILGVLSLLLLGFGANAQFSRLNNTDAAWVDASLQAMVDQYLPVGASVGIVIDGQIAYLKGYGTADVGVDATECTLFRTASICKPLTSVLALQLHESTDFDIDSAVVKYIPDWAWAQNNPNATVRMLMNHTSGMDQYQNWDQNLANNFEDFYPVYDARRSLDIIQNTAATTQGNFNYSTFGYMALGACVSGYTGKPYQELLMEKIVRPLNMQSYQIEYQWLYDYPDRAELYNGSSIINNPGSIAYKAPGGGYMCSAIDMAQFIRGYVNGELYTQPGTEGILRGTMMNDVYTENGVTVIGKNGAQEGSACYFNMSAGSGNGVVILTNKGIGSTNVENVVRAVYTYFNNHDVSDLQGSAFIEVDSYQQMTVSSISQGSDVFSATTLTTSGNLEVQNNSDVRMIARDAIVLKPGFKASEGSYYLAAIENVGGVCLAGAQPKSYNDGYSEEGDPQINGLTLSETASTREVYPNPTSGEVFVRSDDEVDEIHIVDLSGREIQTVQVGGNRLNRIDLGEAPAGIYLVKFVRDHVIIDSKKLVVNH